MPAQNISSFRLRAAVSVTAMAKAVGLSRSRFYDYVKRGVFPWPVYSLATRRPFYTADMQQDIIEARQTGIGCNGEFVVFYERRLPPAMHQQATRCTAHPGLIEQIKSLGLAAVTQPQVDEAITLLYPNGTSAVNEDTVLRTVYRHLRRSIAGRGASDS